MEKYPVLNEVYLSNNKVGECEWVVSINIESVYTKCSDELLTFLEESTFLNKKVRNSALFNKLAIAMESDCIIAILRIILKKAFEIFYAPPCSASFYEILKKIEGVCSGNIVNKKLTKYLESI